MTTEPTTETNLDRLCVYCGSSPGHSPEYVEAAVDIAEELVEREIGLVYGGASVGVMGALADALLEAFATHEPPQVEKWINGTET